MIEYIECFSFFYFQTNTSDTHASRKTTIISAMDNTSLSQISGIKRRNAVDIDQVSILPFTCIKKYNTTQKQKIHTCSLFFLLKNVKAAVTNHTHITRVRKWFF